MAQGESKTKELLQQLARTEYRRSMRADQVFRTLREQNDANMATSAPQRQKRDRD